MRVSWPDTVRQFASTICVLFLAAQQVVAETKPTPSSGEDASGWQLVWQDDFEGDRLDPGNWRIERVPDPHNSELQFYTDRPVNSVDSNLRVSEGILTIEARRETYQHRSHTSGRINTSGLQTFRYGRFEARMRLPALTGMWPAFWLLGENIDTVGWPACGEIDIMEAKGRLPNWTSGAINRGPEPAQNRTDWNEYVLPEGDFHSDWHVFAVEWTPGRIRWFVDGVPFFEVQRPEPFDARWWPYDDGTPYFIILNLAVGGHFDAPHLPPAEYEPQQLLVDWVRVYRSATP